MAGWRRQFRTESMRPGKLPTRRSLQFESPLRSSHGNLRARLEVGSGFGQSHHMGNKLEVKRGGRKAAVPQTVSISLSNRPCFHNRQRAGPEARTGIDTPRNSTHMSHANRWLSGACQPPRCVLGQIYHCYKGQLMDMPKKNSRASSAARSPRPPPACQREHQAARLDRSHHSSLASNG